jgi:hypothetical protein
MMRDSAAGVVSPGETCCDCAGTSTALSNTANTAKAFFICNPSAGFRCTTRYVRFTMGKEE